MKKLKTLISIFIIWILSFGISFADLEITDISITDTTSTWVLENNEIQTITTTSSQVMDKTSYIYYYWQGCSYCAQLDKYLNSVDWYSKLDIIKKEVYFSDENRQNMLDDWKRLWISESDIWVPFFIKTEDWVETPMIWIDLIMNELNPILWDVPENNKKPIVFTILVILAIIIPVFLIKLSNKN